MPDGGSIFSHLTTSVVSCLGVLCYMLITRILIPGKRADTELELERQARGRWEQRYLTEIRYSERADKLVARGVRTAETLAGIEPEENTLQ